MSQQEGQSDNKFEPIKEEEIRSLFQSAARQNAKLQLWIEKQKFGCTAKVLRTIEGSDYTYFTVPREPEVAEFERNLRDSGAEEIMGSLHLSTDLVYFRAQLRRPDAVAVQFKVVPPVYKLQRRRALRIPFVTGSAPKAVIRLSTDDQMPITATVLNVSEGGVGLIIETESDFKRLPKGKRLAELSVTLQGIYVDCTAEVRYTQEVPPSTRMKRQFKVGLSFESISTSVREQISRFVFEESTKYLGRL